MYRRWEIFPCTKWRVQLLSISMNVPMRHGVAALNIIAWRQKKRDDSTRVQSSKNVKSPQAFMPKDLRMHPDTPQIRRIRHNLHRCEWFCLVALILILLVFFLFPTQILWGSMTIQKTTSVSTIHWCARRILVQSIRNNEMTDCSMTIATRCKYEQNICSQRLSQSDYLIYELRVFRPWR